jgi:hypothetical protein
VYIYICSYINSISIVLYFVYCNVIMIFKYIDIFIFHENIFTSASAHMHFPAPKSISWRVAKIFGSFLPIGRRFRGGQRHWRANFGTRRWGDRGRRQFGHPWKRKKHLWTIKNYRWQWLQLFFWKIGLKNYQKLMGIGFFSWFPYGWWVNIL